MSENFHSARLTDRLIRRHDDDVSVLSQLATAADDLPEGMRRIASYIVSDPAGAVGATINELADLSHTSPATVNRFCRRLGYTGYAELKVAVATDNGRAEQANWQQAIGSEVQPGDSLERTAAVIAGGDMLAIQQTVDQLDVETLAAVVHALAAARRIHLYGVSGSSLAAAEMRHRLNVIGLPAWSWSDVHDGLGAAAALEPGDVLVAFSHSGRTHEAVQVLQTAAAAGAVTVAITNSTDSPLAAAADHCLLTAVNEGSLFRSQALAAGHSQLFLVDLIFVAVANHSFERSLATFEKVAHAVQPHLVDRRR